METREQKILLRTSFSSLLSHCPRLHLLDSSIDTLIALSDNNELTIAADSVSRC